MTDVRLMHYAAAWRQEFEQTKSGLLQSGQGFITQVYHVGSTAIPGLIARPIIDIVVGVDDPDRIEFACRQIEGLNYRQCRPPDWTIQSALLAKPRHGEITHHVFLTINDSTDMRRMLWLRDFLRSNTSEAIDFEEAKIQFWKDSDADADAYEQAKANYFASLEDENRD